MSKVLLFCKTLMIYILLKMIIHGTLVRDKSVNNSNQAKSISITEIVICKQ